MLPQMAGDGFFRLVVLDDAGQANFSDERIVVEIEPSQLLHEVALELPEYSIPPGAELSGRLVVTRKVEFVDRAVVEIQGAIESSAQQNFSLRADGDRRQVVDFTATLDTSLQAGEQIAVTVTAYDVYGRAVSESAVLEVGEWGTRQVVVDDERTLNSGADVEDYRFAGLTVAEGGVLRLSTFVDLPQLASLHIQSGGRVEFFGSLERRHLQVRDQLRIDAGGVLQVTPFNARWWSLHNVLYYGAPHGGDTALRDGVSRYRAYGSVKEPLFPGESAIRSAGPGSIGHSAAAGGGALRVDAGSLALFGEIGAVGADAEGNFCTGRVSCHYGSGAGGSLDLRFGHVEGDGRITVDGGAARSQQGSGSGGRVAIRYDSYGDGSQTLEEGLRIHARAGAVPSEGYAGGPGTIFVQRLGQTYGDLIVDADGRGEADAGAPSRPQATLPSVGVHVVTAVEYLGDGLYRVFAAEDAWLLPDDAAWRSQDGFDTTGHTMWRTSLVGRKISFDSAVYDAATYEIVDSAVDSLVVRADTDLSIYIGATLQGVYQFDAVNVRGGAKLAAADLVIADQVSVTDWWAISDAALLSRGAQTLGDVVVEDTTRTFESAVTADSLSLRNAEVFVPVALQISGDLELDSNSRLAAHSIHVQGNVRLTDDAVLHSSRLWVGGDVEVAGASVNTDVATFAGDLRATGDLLLRATEAGIEGSLVLETAHVLVGMHEPIKVGADMLLRDGAVLTVPSPAQEAPYPLHLEVAGTVSIDSDSFIDVSGKGYYRSQRAPFVPADGDHQSCHGGVRVSAQADCVVGHYERARFAGGASRGELPGGGYVTLQAESLLLYGGILANGMDASWDDSTAGGGIHIEVESLVGGGRLEAVGGSVVDSNSNSNAAAGGGRISLYGDDLAGFDFSSTTARGGLNNPAGTRPSAGAGTVYWQESGADYGHLHIVGTGFRPAGGSTPVRAVGRHEIIEISSLGDHRWRIGVADGDWEPSDTDRQRGLAGHWVQLGEDADTAQRYRVIDNAETSLILHSSEDLAARYAVGDVLVGVHVFETLTIADEASVDFGDDRLIVNNPAASSLERSELLVGEVDVSTFDWLVQEAVDSNIEVSGDARTSGDMILGEDRYLVVQGHLRVAGTLGLGQRAELHAGAVSATDALLVNATLASRYLNVNNNLSLMEGAVLTAPGMNGRINAVADARLEVDVDGSIFVDQDSRIDVSAQGFGHRQHGPFGTLGAWNGCHAGVAQGRTADCIYGRYDLPRFPGSGGNNSGAGGGVAIVRAGALALNGQLLADHRNNGAAGGSIDVTVTDLTGSGSISAAGGWNASGGRVALRAHGFSDFNLGNIRATAGGGAPGTIYLENLAEDTLHLRVDNDGLNATGAVHARAFGEYRVVGVNQLSQGLWELEIADAQGIRQRLEGQLAALGEGSLVGYDLSVDAPRVLTITADPDWDGPWINIGHLIQVVDLDTGGSHTSHSFYYNEDAGPAADLEWNHDLPAGNYRIVVGSQPWFDAEAALAGERNAPGAASRFRFDAVTVDPASAAAEGPVDGMWVDLDATDPESPLYRIETGSVDRLVIRTDDDLSPLLGNRITGAHVFDTVHITGNGQFDAGAERLVIRDPDGSQIDEGGLITHDDFYEQE
ncbi:hypothetical protein CAI21_19385 [Alkalilimnicola ehrlichii]|nr:hypothetical protein CAI21_19385 [Alkalilimnicola ehrlichii]